MPQKETTERPVIAARERGMNTRGTGLGKLLC